MLLHKEIHTSHSRILRSLIAIGPFKADSPFIFMESLPRILMCIFLCVFFYVYMCIFLCGQVQAWYKEFTNIFSDEVSGTEVHH